MRGPPAPRSDRRVTTPRPAFFGGSCCFNNAAAAAQRLRSADAGFERVAIVDIDAHQGNGTQEIFWDRADVLFASVHVDPAEAGSRISSGTTTRCGGGAGVGWNLNVPVPGGSGDEPAGRRRATPGQAWEHDAGAIVVSLGLDGAEHDPAAPLQISREGFAAAGARIGALGLPTVFVQEGGYDLSRLVDLVLAVLTGFESTAGPAIPAPPA